MPLLSKKDGGGKHVVLHKSYLRKSISLTGEKDQEKKQLQGIFEYSTVFGWHNFIT